MQSDLINELAAALAKAQAVLTLPKKNREVSIKTEGKGTYKFEYTTLDAMIEHVRPILTENGLWFIQTIGREGPETRLDTMLTHSSGQWVRGTVLVPSGNGRMQEFGSSLTYLRRYALAALLGIASEDDDDANTADGNTVAEKTDRQIAPPPTGPDRKAAATKWGTEALDTIRAFKTANELSAWHTINANGIAAVRGFNEALHGRIVKAIHEREMAFQLQHQVP